MSSFYAAATSRIQKNNNITFTGNAASTPSTTFGAQSRQILVTSTLACWLRYGSGAQTAVAQTDVYVPANVPLSFTVTPGQQAAAISTSTSTGSCAITELGA